jgi:predicted GH43/DUF377 family glycosyl hydrolase
MNRAILLCGALATSIAVVLFICLPVKPIDIPVNNILQPITTLNIATVPKMLNGGIMQLPNKEYVLVHRKNNNIYEANYYTELGLASLNTNFAVINNHTLKLSSAPGYELRKKDTAQDPRLFTVGKTSYMLYNEKNPTTDLREMHLATVQLDNAQPTITNIKRLHYAPAPDLVQKNWVPFAYNDQMYFIYSFDPYTILQYDTQSEKLTAIDTVKSDLAQRWQYGVIRGGTPAIYVPELDAYLGFFHSSIELEAGETNWSARKTPRWRKYYMGAYLFANKPPFALKAFTPVPLAYKELYANKDQKFHIIFPAGLVEQKDEYLISAGIDDAKTMLFTINKQELLNSFDYIS